MSTPETNGLNIAAELAGLRGEMATGFARVEGAINALTQSVNRTRDDLEDLETDLENLAGRVSALEARRVPWPLVTTVSGVASAAVAGAALLLAR